MRRLLRPCTDIHSKRLTGAALFAQPAGAVEQSSERPESGHFPPEQTRPHTHTNTLMHAHTCHCLRLGLSGSGGWFPPRPQSSLWRVRSPDWNAGRRPGRRGESSHSESEPPRRAAWHRAVPLQRAAWRWAVPPRARNYPQADSESSLAMCLQHEPGRGGESSRSEPLHTLASSKVKVDSHSAVKRRWGSCARLPHRKSKSTHIPQ
jgi:hypothetical protein